MKIFSVLVFLLLSSLVFADHICKINYLLPSTSFDHDFLCANSTDGSVDAPAFAIIPAAESRSVSEVPEDEDLVLTFLTTNLWGSYIESGMTEFVFQISAGDAVGSAAQCEISYDFDGDGDWDRIEMYDIFATNPVEGEFESWDSFNTTENVTGDFGNFIGGSIRLRVWTAFGEESLRLRIGASGDDDDDVEVSYISFPFEFEEVCCGKITLLRNELTDLMDRMDMLSSKLANLTGSCCGTTGTSSSSGATTSGATTAGSTDIGTSTAIGTVTSVATTPETVPETTVAASTATAVVSSSSVATDVGTAVGTEVGTATAIATAADTADA